MALHTAAVFHLLALGILGARPGRGVMEVITNDSPGGVMARRLLPGMVLILSVLGWLRLEGQRHGFYGSELGTTLYTIANIVLFGALILWAAKSLHRADAVRQQAQAALEKSLTEIQDLYNNAPCGYHSVGVDGFFLAINDTELDWLGYTREELVGKKRHSDLVSSASRAAYDKGFAHFKEHGEVKDLEFQLVRKDGSVIEMLLNATGVRDAEGRLLHSRSTMFDITVRKNAERERDRFFTLSLDMLCIAGMDGYFKQLNPAFHQILGYTTEELKSRPFLDFVHPDDRAGTLAEVSKLNQGAVTLQFENRYQCKDGSWRWLSWKTQPFPGEGLLYATARDITDRKKAEAAIEQLNAELQERANQLEALNAELEAFSYSVSHDLRAPLRHVQGYVNMLKTATADQLPKNPSVI
jgi:PAS domain S-box-containing protein